MLRFLPSLLNRAHDNFEKIKGVYGAGSCYLLQVNSRAPGIPSQGTPDPWSQFSSLGGVADHEVVGVTVGGIRGGGGADS